MRRHRAARAPLGRSDGPQQIPAAEFAEFAGEIRELAALMGKVIG
jgi:hypothetical protein